MYYMFNCSLGKAFCRGRDRATLVALVRLLFADEHQLSVYSTLRRATAVCYMFNCSLEKAFCRGPGRATLGPW